MLDKRVMGDISVVEFGVYGLIAYSSLLMLIISTIKEVPNTRRDSIVRSMFFIPGLVCAFILASSGVHIVINDVDTTTITNDTVSTIFYESTHTVDQITLMGPIWITVHSMIGIILLVYIIKQILLLLTAQE